MAYSGTVYRDELPLKIHLSGLTDFFLCPVCMSQMEKTCTTPCGHRYCNKCIRECVDRHHKCPCCNKKLKLDQLIKDPLFDDLITKINEERDAAEKTYFDTLIDKAAKDYSSKQEAVADAALTPLQDVLTKHLKASLLAHEQYFEDLKREFQRKHNQLETTHIQAVADLRSHMVHMSAAELRSQEASLKQDLKAEQDELNTEMEKVSSMVAETYEKYLMEHIPSLSILPVTLSVNLLNKGIVLENITLKPQQTMDDLIDKIIACMSQREDKVVSVAEDVKFVHFGAFSKCSSYEMQHTVSDIVQHGATHPDIYILPQRCCPVLQFHLKSGCEIAVYGTVRCESDLPKQCFVDTFQADEGHKMDYFACKDCRFNWICRPCVEVCHKDHLVSPYIMNHQPTWACCYCPKKKTCVIKQ